MMVRQPRGMKENVGLGGSRSWALPSTVGLRGGGVTWIGQSGALGINEHLVERGLSRPYDDATAGESFRHMGGSG